MRHVLSAVSLMTLFCLLIACRAASQVTRVFTCGVSTVFIALSWRNGASPWALEPLSRISRPTCSSGVISVFGTFCDQNPRRILWGRIVCRFAKSCRFGTILIFLSPVKLCRKYESPSAEELTLLQPCTENSFSPSSSPSAVPVPIAGSPLLAPVAPPYRYMVRDVGCTGRPPYPVHILYGGQFRQFRASQAGGGCMGNNHTFT